jgi:hypothetical protein
MDPVTANPEVSPESDATEKPLTFREVYHRHRHVWNGMASIAFLVFLMITYAIYLGWFVTPGSQPLISGGFVGKFIVGYLVVFILHTLNQGKK